MKGGTQGTDGTCASSRGTVGIPHGEVGGCTDVSKDNEQAMMTVVAQQPVSIAIETDQSIFQLYSSGALTASCGTRLDHGVLAVGYSSFDLGETVDVRMDSFAGETETIDKTGSGLLDVEGDWSRWRTLR